jgi:hypothetical protein
MRVQFYTTKAVTKTIRKDFFGIFLTGKNRCGTAQLSKFTAQSYHVGILLAGHPRFVGIV